MTASRRNAEHPKTELSRWRLEPSPRFTFAREVLVPLAFALTLTFVLTPAVILLEKLRIGRVSLRSQKV